MIPPTVHLVWHVMGSRDPLNFAVKTAYLSAKLTDSVLRCWNVSTLRDANYCT